MSDRIDPPAPARDFPFAAGLCLGLGMGGFFDGIVFHQILQWHHMASAEYPATDLANLRFNTLLDGFFHAATWLLVAIGIFLYWRRGGGARQAWPARLLAGSLLAGFGLFNLVEGTIDHLVLGIHHVNETVPPSRWMIWDVAFLLWGAAMLLGGLWLCRRRASA